MDDIAAYNPQGVVVMVVVVSLPKAKEGLIF